MTAQANGLGTEAPPPTIQPQRSAKDLSSAMPQSLANVLIHLVYSTKHRTPRLKNAAIREALYAGLGQAGRIGGGARRAGILGISRSACPSRGSTDGLGSVRHDFSKSLPLAQFASKLGHPRSQSCGPTGRARGEMIGRSGLSR